MGMVEIIVDFVKHGGNPRATYLCLIIVKLHFARTRNNFSTPNTYLVQKRKLYSNIWHSSIIKKKLNRTI
jgi:hypothetical protein